MTEETIFSVARQKTDPAERAAFLDEACGNDSALRARVEGLLQSHDGGGSFLARPVAEWPTGSHPPPQYTEVPPADWGAPEPATESGPGPGARVGPYKLLQQIGAGGMGVVWMAEQSEPVRRRVALKVIKAGMDSAQVLARFDAERQALALMDHPNIAKVLDAGSTEQERPYFVMELVKGVPITRFCDENRLTPRQRLELFIPVCEAVQHAHQKGIIHRDLKPSNVLVASYDGRAVPKVIDFGVAKAVGQQLTERTLYTGFGALIGTLEYMSPEQAEFNALDIDTRSDVYALGAMLYELLTGTTPLSRERLKKSALTEALRVIHEEEPPRPSTRLSESKETLPSISIQRRTEPAQLTRLMRGELDWIVMRALEKDRSRRYETANGLARDLQRYLDDEPVEACPPSAGYRLRKIARKHRGLLVTTAAFLALLVTAVVVTTCLAVWARHAEKSAEERFDEAREAGRRLRENERVLRNNLYASRSALIQSSWEADNVGRARELLELQRPRPGEPDLRGFEWYYWHRLCHAERRTTHLALWTPFLSRNGRYVATPDLGEHGLHVLVYDTASGELRLSVKTGDLLEREKAVCAVALTPDGARLAAAVSVTADPEAGKPHGGRVAMLQMQVADDVQGQKPRPRALPLPRHVVKVWDVATGEEQASLTITLSVRAVALSSDGRRVAVSGATGSPAAAAQEIQVWGVAEKKKLLTLSGGSAEGGLLFSPDGTRLAAPFCPHGGKTDPQAHRLKVWDTSSGKELLALTPQGNITSRDLAFSPDGKRLAAGVSPHYSRDAGPQLWQVQVWDVSTGRELLRLKRNGADVTTDTPLASPVAFSPDGLRLACIEDGRIVKIWDAVSGDPLQVLKGHRDTVEALAFSADGAELYSAETNLIKAWDASSPQRWVRVSKKKWYHVNLPSPDGTRIVSVLRDADPDVDRAVYYLSDNSGRDIVRLNLPDTAHMLWLNWRRDGRQFAGVFSVAAGKGPIEGMKALVESRVWDGATGKVLHRFRGDQGDATAAWSSPLFRPDGSCVVAVRFSGPLRNVLQVWDVTAGRVLFSAETNYQGVNSLTLAPNGRRVAACVFRQISETECAEDIRFWDVATGGEILTLRDESNPRRQLSNPVFSPDGTRLVALQYPQKPGDVEQALVWDTASGQLVSILKGHAGVGSFIVFSPDGRRIVSCSARFGRGNDCQIHLWDTATGAELASLPVDAACYGAKFSPDGHRLIAMTERTAGMQQPGVVIFRPEGVTVSGQSFAHKGDEILRIWDATPQQEELRRANMRKATN